MCVRICPLTAEEAQAVLDEYSSAEKPLNIANWSRGYCA